MKYLLAYEPPSALRRPNNMNLENIKREGYKLGLEAELNVQNRGMTDYIKERKYGQALQCCGNCAKLLEELSFITKETPT